MAFSSEFFAQIGDPHNSDFYLDILNATFNLNENYFDVGHYSTSFSYPAATFIMIFLVGSTTSDR